MLCTGVTEMRQDARRRAVPSRRDRSRQPRGRPAAASGAGAAVDRRRARHDAQPGLDRAERERACAATSCRRTIGRRSTSTTSMMNVTGSRWNPREVPEMRCRSACERRRSARRDHMRRLRPRHAAGLLRRAARRSRGRSLSGLRGGDFYIRKDFDPKIGLTVVIIGALISAAFYWYGRDLIAYSILGGAALIDLVVYGRLKDLTVCYRCHSEFRGAYPSTARRLRSAHRRRARDGIRAADRTAVVFSYVYEIVSRTASPRRSLPPRRCSGPRESRCSRRPATGS